MNFAFDYLIIGGGIAGTMAAETIRRQDPRGTIAILNAEPHPLYSRVLLPAYMQGKVRRDQVFLRTLLDYDKNGIQIFLGELAAAVDITHHEVRTSRANIFHYKKLLAAGGGSVRPWRASGSGWEHACRLQTIEDADKFIAQAEKVPLKEAIVVGAGFIGMEFVNSLVARGFRVSLVTSEGGCWFGRLGAEGSQFLERAFLAHGVAIYPASQILFLEQDASGMFTAKTSKGAILEAGIVAVGVGLERNVDIYQGLGFEIERGIKTNEYLETGVEDVWAAGDVAEYYSTLFGTYEVVGNWTNAFQQGRVAGLNMSASLAGHGDRTAFTDIATYSITVLGKYVTFLGSAFAGKGREVINRIDPNGAYLEKFFLRDSYLVGAAMINKFEDKKILETMMRLRVLLANAKSELADPACRLADIVAAAGAPAL